MCLSQSFPGKRGGKTRPQIGFHFTVQKRPVPGSSRSSFAKRPHLESRHEAYPSVKKSAGDNVSTGSTDTRRKGVHGGQCSYVSWSSASSSSSSAVFRLVCFSIFLINEEALHLTGLCLIWFRVTIFSFSPILPCSITSGSSMSRWLPLIIPLFRRRWMSCLLKEQLNHLLVVLVFIVACLWFLSILVASGPHLTWSILIIF